MWWITKRELSRQLEALEQRILNAINEEGRKVMENTNDLGAELLAKEDEIEQAVTDLEAAVTSEIKDATDEITNLLANSVVNPSVAKQIKDRMDAMKSKVSGITAAAKAADPGPQTQPPPPVEPPPVETAPPVEPAPAETPVDPNAPPQ